MQERLTDIQDNYRKYAEGYSQLNFIKEELEIEKEQRIKDEEYYQEEVL